MGERRQVLRSQCDLAWSLVSHHLQRVSTTSLLWQPTPFSWTVGPDLAGHWHPDWVVPEADPAPPATGAWVSWHLGWWWTTAIAELSGQELPTRSEVTWPGDAPRTVSWLAGLHQRWLEHLDRLQETDLDAGVGFPWPAEAGRTVADLWAWVNLELIKNAAELGQVAMLYAVTQPLPSSPAPGA